MHENGRPRREAAKPQGNERKRTSRCPDCNAAANLSHKPTCPLDRALLQAYAADDAWFAANPTETQRLRPCERAEKQMLRFTLGITHPQANVLVTRVTGDKVVHTYDGAMVGEL